MIFIEWSDTDAYFNLAAEEYIFQQLDKDQDYALLWQNRNAVIVGKHQNTIEEVNQDFVEEHHIQVVRRQSGGGAVYHDLGNLNYTFIINTQNLTIRLQRTFFTYRSCPAASRRPGGIHRPQRSGVGREEDIRRCPNDQAGPLAASRHIAIPFQSGNAGKGVGGQTRQD